MRHVFVGERRSNTRVEGGPTDKGAAILMGHNVLMWDRIYDRAFKGRETQNAVNAMASWRSELLEGEGRGEANLSGDDFLSCDELEVSSCDELEDEKGDEDNSDDGSTEEEEPEHDDEDGSTEEEEAEPQCDDHESSETESDSSLEIEC
jgi:hypothetical protein